MSLAAARTADEADGERSRRPTMEGEFGEMPEHKVEPQRIVAAGIMSST